MGLDMAMGQPNAFMLGNKADDNGFSGTNQNGIPGEGLGCRRAIDRQHAKKGTMDMHGMKTAAAVLKFNFDGLADFKTSCVCIRPESAIHGPPDAEFAAANGI